MEMHIYISHIFKCKTLSEHEKNTNPQSEATLSDLISQKQAVSRFMTLQFSRVSLLQSDTAYQGIVMDTCAPENAGEAMSTVGSSPPTCKIFDRLG